MAMQVTETNGNLDHGISHVGNTPMKF